MGCANGATRVPKSVHRYDVDKGLNFGLVFYISVNLFETNTHCYFSMKYWETGDIYIVEEDQINTLACSPLVFIRQLSPLYKYD